MPRRKKYNVLANSPLAGETKTLIFEKIGDEDNEDATGFLSLTWLKNIGSGVADYVRLVGFTGGDTPSMPITFRRKK